ncbi:MAG TPA: class I SAM-dependent methyltransferase [Solimonas sp.]|nr:class I SAM-dependent methyltransferase [Solimonas sp.]
MTSQSVDGWSLLQAGVELVDCPLCGGDRFELLAHVDRYHHGLSTVGCSGCGLAMTNPQPTAAALDQFYARHYRRYYQKVEKPDLAYIRQYRKDERAAGVARYLRDQGLLQAGTRVLDIGASEGCILKALRDVESGVRTAAIEPNPDFGAFARSHAGCEVFADLADLPAELRFDLIIINHVYEHMKQPVAYLAGLRERLSERGCIYIDVPDLSEYRGLGDLHIAHLYHFSPATLRRAVTTAGFEVLQLEQHAPVMHPKSVRTLIRPAAGVAAGVPAQNWSTDWDRIRDIQRSTRSAAAPKKPVEAPPSPDPVLVVISYYDRHSPQNLQRLIDSMERHPAGHSWDIAIVANRTSDKPLQLGLKSARGIRVHERENLGMNIGAWDHGWRAEGGYRHYLFLQDECYVVRRNWLQAFVRLSQNTSAGLLGESLNPAWDRSWEQLKKVHAGAVLPDHSVEGKPAPRVEVYLDFLRRQAIPPGDSGRHLRSLVWFARRETLETIGGFPTGANYGECIAAEIGVSRKVESLGLRALQVASEPFRFIRHFEYNRDTPTAPYTHKAVRRALESGPDPRALADKEAVIAAAGKQPAPAPPWGEDGTAAAGYWQAVLIKLRLRDERIAALERKLAQFGRWQRWSERLRHPFRR